MAGHGVENRGLIGGGGEIHVIFIIQGLEN
jgi:hypothetical protein